jgi:hypothetical protein
VGPVLVDVRPSCGPGTGGGSAQPRAPVRCAARLVEVPAARHRCSSQLAGDEQLER